MSSLLSSSLVNSAGNYFKFRLGCIIISLHFIILLLSCVYHSYTLQSVHHAVPMQWPGALLYGFDPERLQSDLWQGTCTVQFELVCGNGKWIGSAVSNAIVRSWLRSTASGSCLLSYTSVTLLKYLIIDPTNSGINFSNDLPWLYENLPLPMYPTINDIISDIQCFPILYSKEFSEIENAFFSFINSPEEAVFLFHHIFLNPIKPSWCLGE